MELMIQDPTYSATMRLGEALIDACNIGGNGAGAFAFAEENGIDLFLGDTDFEKYIKANKYELIVGTDSITDPKAVARLRTYCRLYKNLTVYGYVHDARKNLFHPKVTWFETTTGGISIIGSGNLTERGLFHNVEMYSYNTLNNTEMAKLKSDWEDWLDYSINNNFLFNINDPIIDYAVNLSAAKKSRTFTSTGGTSTGATVGTTVPGSILKSLYSKQPKATSVSKPILTSIPRTKKSIPKKSSAVIATSIPSVAPVVVPSGVNPVSTEVTQHIAAHLACEGTRANPVAHVLGSDMEFTRDGLRVKLRREREKVRRRNTEPAFTADRVLAAELPELPQPGV